MHCTQANVHNTQGNNAHNVQAEHAHNLNNLSTEKANVNNVHKTQCTGQCEKIYYSIYTLYIAKEHHKRKPLFTLNASYILQLH